MHQKEVSTRTRTIGWTRIIHKLRNIYIINKNHSTNKKNESFQQVKIPPTYKLDPRNPTNAWTFNCTSTKNNLTHIEKFSIQCQTYFFLIFGTQYPLLSLTRISASQLPYPSTKIPRSLMTNDIFWLMIYFLYFQFFEFSHLFLQLHNSPPNQRFRTRLKKLQKFLLSCCLTFSQVEKTSFEQFAQSSFCLLLIWPKIDCQSLATIRRILPITNSCYKACELN